MEAAALFEQGLALYRVLGDNRGIADSLTALGVAVERQGDFARATLPQEESPALYRELGDRVGAAGPLIQLGWVAYLRGQHDRAVALQEEALALFRQPNYRWGVAWMLASLGCMLQAGGENGRAATYLREALVLGQEIGVRGLLAAVQGQAARAARLGGATEALRAALGAALHPVLHAGHERAARAMRDALGEAACTAAWAEGQALSQEEAVALALQAVLH